MLILILGILDILAGLSILFREFFAGIVLVVGFLVLLKGIFSVIGGLMSKFFLDIFGWIDVLAGIVLLLNIDIPLVWIAIIIKGIYSIMISWK